MHVPLQVRVPTTTYVPVILLNSDVPGVVHSPLALKANVSPNHLIMKNSISLVGTSLVLGSSLWAPVDAAWIVRSRHNNTWATGLGRYDALRRVLAVNTKFHDEADATTSSSGLIDTDCQVLLADATGSWVELPFETPQLCVGGMAVIQDAPGTAIVVGIDGDQASLLNIIDVGTASPQPGDAFDFDEGLNKIPVAVNRGDPIDPYVYIALHDIGDNVKPSGFGQTRVTNLKNMMSYWESLTNPANLTQTEHVPQIIKIHPGTGGTQWLGVLHHDEGFTGSTTIASMEYANDLLIVCGSTNGSGEYVGSDTDGSWDGYVVFIDAIFGVPDSVFVNPDTNVEIDRASIRIRSTVASNANDYIHDSCMIDTDLFVVGTTEGQFDSDEKAGGAFIVKIDTVKRSITARIKVTEKQRTGLKIVCSTTHVYIGGHIVYADDEDLEQDIYVMSYDKDLLNLQWSINIDSTPYFEELRRDQLVDLQVNLAGDINVLWNSQKLSEGINQVLFMDLQSGDGANEIQKGARAPDIGGIPEGGIPVEPIQKTKNGQGSDNKGLAIGLGIGIPVALAIIVGAYTWMSNTKQTDKSPVVDHEDHGESVPEVGTTADGSKNDGVI
jgi:hypothetical protein